MVDVRKPRSFGADGWLKIEVIATPKFLRAAAPAAVSVPAILTPLSRALPHVAGLDAYATTLLPRLAAHRRCCRTTQTPNDVDVEWFRRVRNIVTASSPVTHPDRTPPAVRRME